MPARRPRDASRRDRFDVAPRSRYSALVAPRTASGNRILAAGERYRICLRVATPDGITSEPVCRQVLYQPG